MYCHQNKVRHSHRKHELLNNGLRTMRSWIPQRWNKAAKVSCVTCSVLPALMSLAMATHLPLLLLFWPCWVARGILVFQPGIKPGPLHWKCKVLTNGPPGKSESLCLYSLTRDQTHAPCSGVQSPNHWVTREVSIPLHLDVAAKWIFLP